MPTSARMACAVTALGALLGTLGAGTSHPGPGAPRVRDHVAAGRRSAVLRYWTIERMLRALAASERTWHRPATVPAPEPPPASRSPASPLAPRSPEVSPASAEVLPLRTAPDRRTTGTGPGSPWTSPGAVRATTGKVFFTVGGDDQVCSAGTISGANRDLVVTAAHCVQDASGVWARNWIYVPGYDRGHGPYGVFTARRFLVPNAWSRRHDESHDVAIVALDSVGGRHVADVVGAQKVAFDQPRGGVVYGFGYPTGGRYDGERLAYCSGRTHPDAHRLTEDQGLRCDMSEGASGGPWLARFSPTTGVGVVTSVNSFKYSDDPATMYGPYFGAAVRRLYEEAQHA
jgi:V8-like Glu-specific endopeptidase